MPIHNADVANIFNEVADLLEIGNANPFRVRAYRNAARTINSLSQNVGDWIAQGKDLSELPGIGKDLAGKIKEIAETGRLSLLEEIKHRTSPGLVNLLKIPGLGPKRIQTLHEELGISSLEELEKATRNGKIRQLPGFGEKTEQRILEELERMRGEKRIKLVVAEEVAESLVDYLKKAKGVKNVVVAKSYRRRKETVGDLDILVTCEKGSNVIERFVEYEDVDQVISEGKTRSTLLLRSGLQVDLRVVPQESCGAALQYFTGSKAHNIAIRKLGLERNLKINEYGVFKGKRRIAGKTEKEVYEKLVSLTLNQSCERTWVK